MGIPITVSGAIGTVPERRTTAKDTPYLRFRLGSSERVRGSDGEWTDGGTSWFDVEAWGRLSENALGSLAKGLRVTVQGELVVREWTGQDGSRRITVRITASTIGPDLRFGTASFSRVARPAAAPEPPAARAGGQAAATEDLSDQWAPVRDPGAATSGVLVGAGSFDDAPF